MTGLLRVQGRALARAARGSDAAFARQVAGTFATRILLLALGFVASVIVTRALGPDGRGVYASAVALGAIGLQLGNFGLQASNTYLVAARRDCLPALLGNTLVACTVASLVAGAVAVGMLGVAPHLVPISGAVLALVLAGIPINLVYLLGQGLLLGITDVRLYNVAEVVTKAVAAGLVLALWLGGAISVGSAYAASVAGVAVGGALVLRRLWTALAGARATVSAGLARESIGYGLKAYAAAVTSFLVLRVDILMLDHLAGPATTGQYAVAVTLIDLLYSFPTMAGALLFPRLTAIADHRARLALARRTAAHVAIGMLVVALCAAPFARWGVVLLFGEAFEPAVPAFLWLLPALWLLSVNTIFMNYFAASGLPPVAIVLPVAALIVNAALNVVLIPRLGAQGAALASVAAYGVMLCGSLVYVSRADRRAESA